VSFSGELKYVTITIGPCHPPVARENIKIENESKIQYSLRQQNSKAASRHVRSQQLCTVLLKYEFHD